MKILVLDLETLRSSDEVGGWQNSPAMGVSVLVIRPLFFTNKGNVYHNACSVYTEPISKSKEDIVLSLQNADVIVSHNGLSFDYRVLAGELSLSDEFLKSLAQKTIDFCFTLRMKHRLHVSLTNVASRTLGRHMEKELPGDKVIEYWRSGEEEKREAVRKHCQDDVDWTRQIFEKMLENTKWKNRKSPSGRILFYNPEEAEKRKEGLNPTRRITSSCIIPYPAALREFLIKTREEKEKVE